MKRLPTREQLFKPVVTALEALGGSGSIDEITERVISDLRIPENLKLPTYLEKKVAKPGWNTNWRGLGQC